MKTKAVVIILALLLPTYDSISQSRWVRQYYEELSAPGHYMSTTYDYGYLITGRVVPSYQFTWLIKTDINGEILWEKKVMGNFDRIITDRIKQNEIGNIFLCGSAVLNSNTDPLIIKLNECGEKEWCRIISTTSDNDFFKSIVTTQDGGCAALIYGAYFPLNTYRSGILKFSSIGNVDWEYYHQSSDKGIRNESLSHLLLTPDSGFLMTGYCYYPDPEVPTISWLHPYYVKVDSLGTFEWEYILHSETGDMGGKAMQTITNPSQQFYYSCITHYYHSDTLNARRPAIMKMELQGNVIGVYDLVHEDCDWGAVHSAVFINDSLLAGGIGWGYFGETEHSIASIFDTLGTIKDTITLLNTSWLSKVAKTFDDKLLFYNTIEENGVFSNYLFKLNQDLEHDTIYTMPFTYDSLCPYPIVSDTIVPDDCGLIVSIEEEEKGRRGEGEITVELWPNPCSTLLNISLSSTQPAITTCHPERSEGSHSSYTADVYDIFGRQAPIPGPSPTQGKGEVSLDVSALPPGLYLLVVKDGLTVKASAKFVVAR